MPFVGRYVLACVVVLAVEDFLAGLYDALVLFGSEQAELEVGFCSCHLRDCQAIYEEGVFVEVEFADFKILDSPERLHAVEGAGGNFARADEVAFYTEFFVHGNGCFFTNVLYKVIFGKVTSFFPNSIFFP